MSEQNAIPEEATPDPDPQPTQTPDKPRRARRGLLIAGGALVVLLGAAYGIGYAMAGDNAPRNASVAGVAIGGQPRAQALDTLRAALDPAAAEPVTLVGTHAKAPVNLSEAGFGIDYDATLSAAGVGRSANPIDIWRNLTGGTETKPVFTGDEAAAEPLVAAVAPTFAVAPADADLAVTDGAVHVTDAIVGTELDVPATTKAVIEAWRTSLSGTERTSLPATAVETSTQPAITQAEVDQVAEQVNTYLAPVTVTTTNGDFQVTAAQLGSALDVAKADGTITATPNLDRLFQAAAPAIAQVTVDKPVDASFTFENDRPKIIDGKNGSSISHDTFVTAIEPVLAKPAAERSVAMELSEVEPAFTTAAAQALGVNQVIGEFTTYWEAGMAPYRNANLQAVARYVSGTLLKPGETFSYDQGVGPRTAERGFKEGTIIDGGRLVMSLGGGISQGATTLFNAAFFAGMTDVEHHPHTLYFSRYPVGREATVSAGTLDLRFRNDTKYGALIQIIVQPNTSSTGGSITARIWSTPTWDEVRSTDPVRSNFTSGTKREVSAANCLPQSAAEGFDASYSRLFINGGAVVRKEDFFWRYSPQDAIVCKAS